MASLYYTTNENRAILKVVSALVEEKKRKPLKNNKLDDGQIDDALEKLRSNGVIVSSRTLRKKIRSELNKDYQFVKEKKELFESKLIPAVSNAISSVLSRSKRAGVYEKCIELISDGDNTTAIDPDSDSETPTEMLLGIPIIFAASKRKTKLNELLKQKLKHVILGKLDDNAVKKLGRNEPPTHRKPCAYNAAYETTNRRQSHPPAINAPYAYDERYTDGVAYAYDTSNRRQSHPPAINAPYAYDERFTINTAKHASHLHSREMEPSQNNVLYNRPIEMERNLPVSQRDKWTTRYNELVAYKQQHGHFDVSVHDESKRGLFYWVGNTRTQFKNGKLSEERIAKMNEIGFVWNRQIRTDWTTRYNELVAYKKHYGHCNVSRHNKDNKSLGHWVDHVRRRYKNGKLSNENISKLIEIGFVL